MSRQFWMPESPLHGHHVPPDWKHCDRSGKCRALVAAEIAKDLAEARSLLARHGNAVKAFRKQKAELEKERRWWEDNT